MLKNIEELKRGLKSIKDSMRSIIEEAQKSETRSMTDEQDSEYRSLEAEKNKIEKQIELAERSNSFAMKDADPEVPEKRDAEHSFGSFGEFLQAVRSASTGGVVDSRLSTEQRAATGMNVTIPSDGGYLVQQDFLEGIQKRIYDKSLIAGRCSKISIGANSNGIKWIELDESSRKDGYRHGGVRAYWQAEAGTVANSFPKLAKKSLDLEKLMAFCYVTEELLQDATALESFINEVMDQEFAFLLDQAIIEGTGAGTPLGILNSDSTVIVPKRTGQGAKTVVFENLTDMRARMWARSRPNGVWFINQDVEPELHTLALAVGTGGVPVYMPASGVSGAPYDTLFGMPVIPVEHCKTLGTQGDIILADMSQYRLIDKNGLKQDVSMHVRFLNDEQVYRFTLRVNGTPLWDKALTPKNGTNTQSPFIALETRS